jgi:hypothetical protein
MDPLEQMEHDLALMARARSQSKKAEDRLRKQIAVLRARRKATEAPDEPPAVPPEVDEVSRARARQVLRRLGYVPKK